MRIVGESSDPNDAMRVIAAAEPEAVLLDIRLRGSSGLDLCGEILAARPACKVVFLTVYDDEQYLYQALRVGAAGFLLKRIRGAELVDYLRRIRDGEILIDPALAGRVALSAARLHSGEFWPGAHLGLTQRESEVLALLVAGLSNRAIATRAGGQRGDGEDPLPRHLPQARRVGPGGRGGRRAARGRVPLTALPGRRRRRARGAPAVQGDRHHLRRALTWTGSCRASPASSPRRRRPTCASCTCSTNAGACCSSAARRRHSTSWSARSSWPSARACPGWVADHGEPAVIIGDKTHDPRYRYIPALRGEDYTSMVSVPIVTPLGHLVGVLNVHTRLRREFAASDVDLLRSVAGLVAGAIENARLHQRLAEREEALERFAEQTMQWQEHERRRLAGEIHDGISQRIVSLFFHLSAAADAIGHSPDLAAEQVARAQELAGAALDETRLAIAGLRPPVLDDLGLAASLASLGHSFPHAGRAGAGNRAAAGRAPRDRGLPDGPRSAAERRQARQRAISPDAADRDGRTMCCWRSADDGAGFDAAAAPVGRPGGPDRVRPGRDAGAGRAARRPAGAGQHPGPRHHGPADYPVSAAARRPQVRLPDPG